MKKTSFAMSLAGAILLPSAVHAVTLVTYDFNTAGTVLNASADVTGSTVSNGGGLSNFSDAGNPGGGYATPVLQVNPHGSASNITGAVANDSFFELTLTINAGVYQLDELALQVTRGGNSSTERGFTLRSDLTGTTDLFQVNAVPSVRTTFTDYTIDLTAFSEFQAIDDEVTFQFYIHTPATGNSLEFDNLVFSGDPVPEPTGVLLSALSAMALLRRSRRD
ncbi:MAG: hypothetical protein ACQKBY_12235 [Verrucomicrobiales bacterium]